LTLTSNRAIDLPATQRLLQACHLTWSSELGPQSSVLGPRPFCWPILCGYNSDVW